MAREAKGLRPEDLAAKTGIGFRTIGRIEAGETDRMRMETARLLSAELNIPLEELRPPKVSDDEDIHRMLADVLSRLQRIESAVGVETPQDDVAEQDADEESLLLSDSTAPRTGEQGHEGAK